ncbi:MAG: TIGR01244 family sulfur transferase [Aquamicrobium sp.]|uniref:TIGR01244 family sulfur transferase n=1 Tax=Aquamicrobium sp. TaxID=1872579 RepID=UPI00349E812D|nr:TIGR01244 family sulfur transferase [Aquamicrobium sp.]MCO5159014.1 TIGR01244 family sulfur transferase [Aquamicrobium sp.]
MEIRQITEDYFVAPQIAVDDIAAIREAGFRSVISNRPDAEDGAVPHGEVEAAVRAAGLEFRYIPVVSGSLTQENVDAQARALDELPKPVLAYCRSGARCTNLYMLVRQQNG